ncbi:hypothetical protein V2J09_000933 [Rumex salicifolius]
MEEAELIICFHNKGKAAVPKFGAWDQKAAAGGEFTGYSVVFTKAREKRKQTKVEAPPVDLTAPQDVYGGHPQGHDEAQTKHAARPHRHHHHHGGGGGGHYDPLHHHRRHSHPKAPAFDSSTNKEEPNKGMKKLLQCWGGGGGGSSKE